MEKARKIETRKCKVCGKEFTCRTDSTRMYCNLKCGASLRPKVERHHICPICGKDYIDNRLESKYCSSKCAGKAFKRPDRICLTCGKQFYPQRYNIVYCSQKCAQEAKKKRTTVLCGMCGKELSVIPSLMKKNKHHFCTKDCYDRWLMEHSELRGVLTNGGVYHHSAGYTFLYQEHKNYKAQHRLVMEEHLGRKLRSDEIVHHKDGDKTNNDISNLEIVTRAEHINIHRDELLKAREMKRGSKR